MSQLFCFGVKLESEGGWFTLLVVLILRFLILLASTFFSYQKEHQSVICVVSAFPKVVFILTKRYLVVMKIDVKYLSDSLW